MPDPLDLALPPRVVSSGARARRADQGTGRFFRSAFERATVPPPPAQWAHFGRAYVVPPARISRPDCIWLGDGVVVHEHVWMSVVQGFDDIVPRLVLEDGVRVGRGCQFSVVGEVVVERGALLGDFVQIGDTSHPYDARLRGPAVTRPRPTRVGARAMIGGHAVVLPGVTVGAGAVVDHHSVVRHDVAPGSVVAGNPARVVQS